MIFRTILLVLALSLPLSANVPPSLVYVEWIDIVATDGGWHSTDELEDWIQNEECVVRQVGFLYRQTDDYIVLVDSYFDEYNVGYAVKIPMGCVKKMKLK